MRYNDDVRGGLPVVLSIIEEADPLALHRGGVGFFRLELVVVSDWSEERLSEWRSSLEEWSSDPMFSEFVAEEREREAAEAELSASSGDLSEGEFAEAMEALAMAEIGPWDREGWSLPVERPVVSPWEEEAALEEALSSLGEDWEEGVVESVVEGVVEGVERPVERPVLPGEAVVSPVLSSSLEESSSSLESFLSGGRRLREGVSCGEFDDFGDRVDVDGREARGLVRVEGASGGDGRRYWFFVSVWLREVGVADWAAAFVSSKELEGLGILHDSDRVDDHLHAVVRRPRRLKGSVKSIRKMVARMWGCPVEAVSVSSVDDTRSAVAYLTHESAAGLKHRYAREDVVEAGVALADWLPEGSTDWVDVVSDMQSVLDDVFSRRERMSFRGFLSWCHIERPEWWRVLVVKRSARLYIKDFINS